MAYETHGNLYFWQLGVTNLAVAKAFFGKFLNWEFEPDSGNLVNVSHAGGLIAGQEGFTFYFWVEDVPAAANDVVRLGGKTSGKETGRSGDWAECVDPNGVLVNIGRLSSAFEASLPASQSGGAELAYFVLPAADLERGKAYYSDLLGWKFEPGDQYARIRNVRPPGGLNRQAGSRPLASFHVTNIEAAVEKVRSLHGTVAESAKSDAGWSADCIDDQGTKFAVWQPAAVPGRER